MGWIEEKLKCEMSDKNQYEELVFLIEKRAGHDVLVVSHEDGREWCRPASRYEVKLWEELQAKGAVIWVKIKAKGGE